MLRRNTPLLSSGEYFCEAADRLRWPIIHKRSTQRRKERKDGLARQGRNQKWAARMAAANGDAEGVIEYSRGQSALFARRPRSATPIKGMHPEGVRHKSRKYFLGEDRLQPIIGEFCCTPTGCGGRYCGSRPGAPRKKRALPPAILFDAFGV